MKKTIEVKNGKKWEVTNIIDDELSIYQSLANDLIAKKINQCSYVKSIKRVPLYNGTQKIIVTYDNDCRAIYVVSDR